MSNTKRRVPNIAALSLGLALCGSAQAQTYEPVIVPGGEVERPQVVEVTLAPAGATDPDRLVVYTGVMVFGTPIVGGTSGPHTDGFRRVELRLALPVNGPRHWTDDANRRNRAGEPGTVWTLFKQGTGMAALGSLSDGGEEAVFAVDDAWVDIGEGPIDPDHPGRNEVLILHVKVAVKNGSNNLRRASYQVTVTGRTLPRS